MSPVPARRRVRSLCRRVRIVRCEHNRVACGHGFPRAFFELLGGVGRSSFGFMALSVEERERFLAEPRVGALSVVEDPARAPLTIPIWYQYIPKGELWVRTGPDSRKVRAIEAAGRFSLMVQRTEPTVRYVSVEGPVTGIGPDDEDSAREMAARYLPEEKVDGFVEYERTHLGEHVIIRMRPEHWLSADLGAL